MKDLEKLAELAKALPAQYKEAASNLVERMGEVIEGIGDKPIEWRPTSFKLVQGTSDRSKLPKGAAIGSFVLGEDLVEQPFPVIPISMHVARQYWDPNPDNAKMLCNSPDASVGFQYGDCKLCPFSKFDEEAKKSQCNKTISFLVITADLSQVFSINFAKTNYASGSDWQSLLRKAGVAPFKRSYVLSSQTSTKSKNVELIKAEPAPNNKIDSELIPFLEELFRISKSDREMSLKKFYEYMDNKKANGQNLSLAPPEHTVELLTASDEVEFTEVTPVETSVTEEKVTKKGTKYAL